MSSQLRKPRVGAQLVKVQGTRLKRVGLTLLVTSPARPGTGAKANTYWHCMQESGGSAWRYMLVGVSPQGGRWVKPAKAGQGCSLLGGGASSRLAGDTLVRQCMDSELEYRFHKVDRRVNYAAAECMSMVWPVLTIRCYPCAEDAGLPGRLQAGVL